MIVVMYTALEYSVSVRFPKSSSTVLWLLACNWIDFYVCLEFIQFIFKIKIFLINTFFSCNSFRAVLASFDE